ncbi:hypothetical protein CBR_g41008 [Chara braunii]|uniref:Uncharacterized protein n=1 Tax=Chara braunii TaxID=69332 RepID=A0A388LV18_CHABU|nr:hypothetical protein CBR_g41008 [Chara braunii]|eukprot:GBG86105.1 hypothetical protein CBR_g41008 [Chara braunii]
MTEWDRNCDRRDAGLDREAQDGNEGGSPQKVGVKGSDTVRRSCDEDKEDNALNGAIDNGNDDGRKDIDEVSKDQAGKSVEVRSTGFSIVRPDTSDLQAERNLDEIGGGRSCDRRNEGLGRELQGGFGGGSPQKEGVEGNDTEGFDPGNSDCQGRCSSFPQRDKKKLRRQTQQDPVIQRNDWTPCSDGALWEFGSLNAFLCRNGIRGYVDDLLRERGGKLLGGCEDADVISVHNQNDNEESILHNVGPSGFHEQKSFRTDQKKQSLQYDDVPESSNHDWTPCGDEDHWELGSLNSFLRQIEARDYVADPLWQRGGWLLGGGEEGYSHHFNYDWLEGEEARLEDCDKQTGGLAGTQVSCSTDSADETIPFNHSVFSHDTVVGVELSTPIFSSSFRKEGVVLSASPSENLSVGISKMRSGTSINESANVAKERTGQQDITIKLTLEHSEQQDFTVAIHPNVLRNDEVENGLVSTDEAHTHPQAERLVLDTQLHQDPLRTRESEQQDLTIAMHSNVLRNDEVQNGMVSTDEAHTHPQAERLVLDTQLHQDPLSSRESEQQDLTIAMHPNVLRNDEVENGMVSTDEMEVLTQEEIWQHMRTFLAPHHADMLDAPFSEEEVKVAIFDLPSVLRGNLCSGPCAGSLEGDAEERDSPVDRPTLLRNEVLSKSRVAWECSPNWVVSPIQG